MTEEISQEQKYLNAITRLKHIHLESQVVENSLDFDSYAVNSIKSSTLNALEQVRSKLCELRGE